MEHLANLKLDIWEGFAQCRSFTVIGLENSTLVEPVDCTHKVDVLRGSLNWPGTYRYACSCNV